MAKRPKSKILINLEYFAFRILHTIAIALPRVIFYPLMRSIFRLLYYVDAKHRNRAIRHILYSGIVSTREEAVALAKRNFAHFGNIVGDILVSNRYLKEEEVNNHAYIGGEIPELIADATRRDENGQFAQCIVATAHFGNWEVAGNLYVWLAKRPVISVMRPLDNPKIGHFLYGVRESDKHEMCPKDGALRRLLRAVKEGRSLCLVLDQHAHREEAIEATCFGRRVWMHASLAKLHLKTGLPIYVGVCRRLDDHNRYVFEALTKIVREPTDDRQADEKYVAQAYMDALEKVVRQAPEQWLWPHRYFVDLRLEDDRAKREKEKQKLAKKNKNA